MPTLREQIRARMDLGDAELDAMALVAGNAAAEASQQVLGVVQGMDADLNARVVAVLRNRTDSVIAEIAAARDAAIAAIEAARAE